MQFSYLPDILVEYGRIMHLKGGNIGFVDIFFLFFLQILRTSKELSQQQDSQYHAHHP